MLNKPSNMKHRKAMARKYSPGEVDLFEPEETTAIPDDLEESQRRADGKSQLQSFAAFL